MENKLKTPSIKRESFIEKSVLLPPLMSQKRHPHPLEVLGVGFGVEGGEGVDGLAAGVGVGLAVAVSGFTVGFGDAEDPGLEDGEAAGFGDSVAPGFAVGDAVGFDVFVAVGFGVFDTPGLIVGDTVGAGDVFAVGLGVKVGLGVTVGFAVLYGTITVVSPSASSSRSSSASDPPCCVPWPGVVTGAWSADGALAPAGVDTGTFKGFSGPAFTAPTIISTKQAPAPIKIFLALPFFRITATTAHTNKATQPSKLTIPIEFHIKKIQPPV
ncbi:hypothetical protein SAMN02799616_00099 [Paenibacillus sp. UNC499MF]|nr:hypothetical protein SAMN02799616_00099 [Paenibacillus sp. UNC499MF]